MDAAQKLLKNLAILTATALLLSSIGLAATLAAPSTVVISASGSNDASVTSSDGTPVTYTIGPPSYTGGDPAWLTVTGGTTTTATLTFTARNVPWVSASPHSATVTLTPSGPSAGIPAVTIMVTYDSGGGGGGGSATLSASPNTVPLTNTITSATVAISTTSASPITINNPLTVSGTSGSNTWLSAFLNSYTISSTAGATLSVYGNPAGLAAATYQGTVTLTPSTGTPLTVNVNFTVGIGGGSTWSATPSAVAWNFTTGSGTFPFQTIAVGATTGLSSYSVNTTQISSANHWLLVSSGGQSPNPSAIAIPVGVGFTLSVGSIANSLTPGTYTEQANITDQFGIQQATVTVTLTVNGGNFSGLTISPGSVTFTAALNGAQQSQVVNVTSGSGGNLLVNGCTSIGWLTCTFPSNTSLSPGVAAGLTVIANPNGLGANTYSSTLQIQVGAQSGTVNVSLVVGGGSGGTGTAGVAPTSLTFAYQYGTNTAFVARQKLVITGPAGAWSSTKAVTSPTAGTWLNFSPSSGTSLPDPSIDGATPIVSIDPTGLAVGSYGGSITVTTPGGSQVIQVVLHVVTTTIILPNPAGALVFTSQIGQPNPGPKGLFWSDSDNGLNVNSSPVIATANNPWIILSGPTVGSVTVQVDETGLSAGVYNGSITLTQAGAGNSPTTVPILLVVNGGGGGGTFGTLTFSQSSIPFTSTNGSTPSPAVLTVGADANTSFVASIGYTNGSGSWLTMSNNSTGVTTASNPMLPGTTPVNLGFSINPAGLVTGNYGATISFTAANGVVQTVSVTLTVSNSGGGTTGNVTVSPTTLSFAALLGSSPANQILSVTSAAGAAGISFTVTPTTTTGGNWLTAGVGTGTTPLNPLTVIVNSSTLPAAKYSGNIRITPSGGTTVDIPVTLTITAPGIVSATPATLTFAYRLGDSAPAAQPVTVSGSGAFTATPVSAGNWLTVSPATGTTPGTVNVSINTANLTTGGPTYTGTILVAGTGGASGSTTVTVTLNVTSPLPTLSRVTNAASYATGSVSPGEIITLFANDPTHPIGPATPAYLTLDSNGNVATSLGGVQVTIAGYSCPMIYASASQVSAVVPYEVKIYATATVLVKFLGQGSNGVSVNVATTAPGVFTFNSSGTGRGAILNSDLSVNSAANPATRGDIVVIYVTGEGETSPGGVTGKVTTVALPPLPVTPGPLLQPSVSIGGTPANWTFAGEAPGFVSGVLQMNVVVPTNIAAGDQPIVVTAGGISSQQGVTVSLK